MSAHPYLLAASYQRWRQAIGRTQLDAVDPVVRAKFRITRNDRIVTAGSCFAQHIARALRRSSYHFLITESAHPLLPPDLAEQFGYGVYTARTGNIYTARQLLQLQQRAYGQLQPRDDVWEDDGRFYDPFRPAIQPGGFASRLEYERDRAQHFLAVRAALETMDVLIFTLGLTECWVQEDGCVYPVCPGTAAGRFDASKHTLLNVSVAETVSDFRDFVAAVRIHNPHVRIILTVSPVPLAATALDRHVLVSNTYSKSVLRVAAETLAEDPNIQYFPSFEIITGAHTDGRYFAADRRSITQAGVDHVMRLFLQHVTDAEAAEPFKPQPAQADTHFERSQQAVSVLCEEEALDPS